MMGRTVLQVGIYALLIPSGTSDIVNVDDAALHHRGKEGFPSRTRYGHTSHVRLEFGVLLIAVLVV